ncbi:MAG TPA: hypothetical protein VN643_12420 [Pyrinomonadaceae bacterium]|nr:hypothetical protein [Pyrinomonadaceae bacterium]
MTKPKLTFLIVLTLALLSRMSAGANAKSDDFGAVVKAIEQFYGVKHQSIPFLARAGMKAATAAAKIRGGQYKRIAEAGSVKIAFFQDQDFDSRGSIANFKNTLMSAVSATWTPLVQTLSPKDEEQTYVFIRDAGQKINVLVVTLTRREGTVVQVNVSPNTLALLMQSPEDMGKAITDDAAQDDN